jgi:hypothetical protein
MDTTRVVIEQPRAITRGNGANAANRRAGCEVWVKCQVYVNLYMGVYAQLAAKLAKWPATTTG